MNRSPRIHKSTSSPLKQEYKDDKTYSQESGDHRNHRKDRKHGRQSVVIHEYAASGEGLSSFATLSKDGRITVKLDLKHDLPDLPEEYSRDVKEFAIDDFTYQNVPPLYIVIMIVGSRGDVQPYVALGCGLAHYGHRVRIATHDTFRSFVLDAGLEFYPIGGDPKELLSYMVKNPGLLPGFNPLTNGDVGRKRKMLAEIFQGCWRASISLGTEDRHHFVADAIISNPPAFAHIHVAEALGVPLLLSFTMPWSPTKAFPHPLVNVNQSNAKPGLTNYLTYGLADVMTWEGLGKIINRFRTKTLGIPALSFRDGPGLVDRLKVPWTYCLSPALIPKPSDWNNHIDVVGFYFLEQQGYQPDEELSRFLNAGPPPVCIGFGSVVVEDAAAMTNIVFGAIENAGVRALVSVGWGGLGGVEVPSNIFMLGNVPHDWLFQRVAAVVHHSGAGTTAIGLKMGALHLRFNHQLSLSVSLYRETHNHCAFFGDQPFWGAMVYKAGAGPEPIPHRDLNVANLTEAIRFCMSPGVRTAAEAMGKIIQSEDGVKEGVNSFHRYLPLLNMRCDLDPQGRVAVWYWNEEFLRLSAFAAQTLADAGKLRLSDLALHRSKEYDSRKEASDPVAGGAVDVLQAVTKGMSTMFYKPVKGVIVVAFTLPKGFFDLVSGVQLGFANVSRLYGSRIREHGKINNFADGMKEAGKGFYFGFHDGIKGLVTTPMEGAKKDGFVGGSKGSARGIADLAIKPVAGYLGLFAYPAQGAEASIRKLLKADKGKAKKKLTPLDVITETRLRDGIEAVRASTETERAVILQAFEEASRAKMKRRMILGEQAMQALRDGTAILSESATVGDSASQSSSPPLTPSTISSYPPSSSMHSSNKLPHLSPYPPSPPSTRPSRVSSIDSIYSDYFDNEEVIPPSLSHKLISPSTTQTSNLDDGNAYSHEMDFALQLALAEQRGYQRGLTEAQLPK